MIPLQKQSPKHLILVILKLKLVIDAKWECFTCLLKQVLLRKFKEGSGDWFLQFIHNDCTLSNQTKYQEFGLQWTDINYQYNHVVVLLFEKIVDPTGTRRKM